MFADLLNVSLGNLQFAVNRFSQSKSTLYCRVLTFDLHVNLRSYGWCNGDESIRSCFKPDDVVVKW